MEIYNKLVRDKIPEMIARTGRDLSTKVLDDEKYTKYLKETLLDKVIEYKLITENNTLDNNTLEELADVLELIHALVKVHGKNMKALEDIREEKAEKRGDFSGRLLLVEVEHK